MTEQIAAVEQTKTVKDVLPDFTNYYGLREATHIIFSATVDGNLREMCVLSFITVHVCMS